MLMCGKNKKLKLFNNYRTLKLEKNNMEKILNEIDGTVKLVKIDEAAKLFGCAVGTLRNIMTDTRAGENDLPFYKIKGVGIRFNKIELNDWYQKQSKLTPEQLKKKYENNAEMLMLFMPQNN